MNLIGSTKSKISKEEDGENMLYLKVTEVLLVHCNIVNNDYQQDSRVLYTFCSIIYICKSIIKYFTQEFFISKSFNSEFSCIEVWFTDQISHPLDIEDKINISLVIDFSVK